MRSEIANGLSAAEAARRVLGDSEPTRSAAPSAAPTIDEPMEDLRVALRTFDDVAAHAAMDRLISALSLDSFLRDVVLPLLQELGEGWERGEITIAQEHFASNLVRGRLMALGRGWGRGMGKHALLAAPPGELHDLGLVALALVLRDRGWRVTFLGADTPIETIADTARRVLPQVVVLAMLRQTDLKLHDVRPLTQSAHVLVAGCGATPGLADALDVEYFGGGPIEAGDYLTHGASLWDR